LDPDGECDNPRFEGKGMASVLLDDDLYQDASDCRNLMNKGLIQLIAGAAVGGVMQRDRLERGDSTLTSGEYRDNFTFEGERGQDAIIDLRSDEFDPYLIVSTASGEQFDNDDYEGRSLIALNLDETGTYEVTVTSYAEGETGSYTLQMDVSDPVELAGVREKAGSLRSGDRTLGDGEYIDTFEFDGRPGQHVTIDLRSNDFDTHLVLIDPRTRAGRERAMIFRQLLDSETWTYSYLLADNSTGECTLYPGHDYNGRTSTTVARSAQVALILERAGFTQVANLPGGLFRWQGLGFPIEAG
jgi:hypothetical protein